MAQGSIQLSGNKTILIERTFSSFVERRLHDGFAFVIQRGSGFVQQQYLGIFNDGPRYCNPLLLSARHLRPSLSHYRVEFLNKTICMLKFRESFISFGKIVSL